MSWRIATSLACLIAGLVCFSLANFRVVTGALALIMIVLAVVNFVLAGAIFMSGSNHK
jgi:hypothetical protein